MKTEAITDAATVVAVVDNGKSYSDRVILFVRLPPADIPVLDRMVSRMSYPGKVLAVANIIEWRELPHLTLEEAMSGLEPFRCAKCDDDETWTFGACMECGWTPTVDGFRELLMGETEKPPKGKEGDQ